MNTDCYHEYLLFEDNLTDTSDESIFSFDLFSMTNQSLSSARWKGWIVVLETFCVSSLYSAQHLSRVVNWRLKDSSQLVGNRTSSQKLHATIRITVHRRGKFLDFPRVFINIVSGLHQFLTPELHVSDDVDLNIISMSCVWSTWLHESVAHYWRSDTVLLLCQQRNKEWSFLQY